MTNSINVIGALRRLVSIHGVGALWLLGSIYLFGALRYFDSLQGVWFSQMMWHCPSGRKTKPEGQLGSRGRRDEVHVAEMRDRIWQRRFGADDPAIHLAMQVRQK